MVDNSTYRCYDKSTDLYMLHMYPKFIDGFSEFDLQQKSDVINNKWHEALKSSLLTSKQKIEIFQMLFPLVDSDLKMSLWKSSEEFINSYDSVSRTLIISGFIAECDLKLKNELLKKHLFSIKHTVENLENVSENILKVFTHLEISQKKDFIENNWSEILKSALITREQKIEIFKTILSHCNEGLRIQLSKIVEDFNSDNPNNKISVGADFVYNAFPEILKIENLKDQIVNHFKDCIDNRSCIDAYNKQDTILRVYDEILTEEPIMQSLNDL